MGRGSAALLLPLVIGCAAQPEEAPSEPPIAPAELVGGEICADCHDDEPERWRGSHHDLAMQEATESTVLGDFDDTTFEYEGVTTTFFRRDGGYYVRTDGADGELAEYEVAFTFGVEPLQQYLLRFADGRFQALGICWDTRPAAEGGQRWLHLYPGEGVDHEDPLHWTGVYQTWNVACAECHSTGLRKNYDATTGTYATEWAEIDVSCEACHGPGSNHVEWAYEIAPEPAPGGNMGFVFQLKDPAGASWVMDPETGIAGLDKPRTSNAQVETCARCHSRRSAISGDYLHGQPLAQTHRPALLEEHLYYADGQILEEVYVYGSFLQSPMHAAGVLCSDCHDPHSGRLVLDTPDVMCGRCHLRTIFETPEHHHHEADSAGASCVECHMRARTYMQVDPRRDHSFRVPRPDLSVRTGVPNACTDCHGDRSAQWAADWIVDWYGEERSSRFHYGEALFAAREGLPQAGDLLRRVADDPQSPAIVRATALSLLGGLLKAESLPILRRSVGDGDPLVRAAVAEAAEALDAKGRLRLLEPLLVDPVRAVRIQAGRALAGVPASATSARQSSRMESALNEYRQAQELNSDWPPSLANLGALRAERGEFEGAAEAYRSALAIDPFFVGAFVNLADTSRAMGNEEATEETLREGLSKVPDSADLYHALGLSLVRQKRMPEALEALARAVELQPATTRFGYVYAAALSSAGRTREAREVLLRLRASPPPPRASPPRL